MDAAQAALRHKKARTALSITSRLVDTAALAHKFEIRLAQPEAQLVHAGKVAWRLRGRPTGWAIAALLSRAEIRHELAGEDNLRALPRNAEAQTAALLCLLLDPSCSTGAEDALAALLYFVRGPQHSQLSHGGGAGVPIAARLCTAAARRARLVADNVLPSDGEPSGLPSVAEAVLRCCKEPMGHVAFATYVSKGVEHAPSMLLTELMAAIDNEAQRHAALQAWLGSLPIMLQCASAAMDTARRRNACECCVRAATLLHTAAALSEASVHWLGCNAAVDSARVDVATAAFAAVPPNVDALRAAILGFEWALGIFDGRSPGGASQLEPQEAGTLLVRSVHALARSASLVPHVTAAARDALIDSCANKVLNMTASTFHILRSPPLYRALWGMLEVGGLVAAAASSDIISIARRHELCQEVAGQCPPFGALESRGRLGRLKVRALQAAAYDAMCGGTAGGDAACSSAVLQWRQREAGSLLEEVQSAWDDTTFAAELRAAATAKPGGMGGPTLEALAVASLAQIAVRAGALASRTLLQQLGALAAQRAAPAAAATSPGQPQPTSLQQLVSNPQLVLPLLDVLRLPDWAVVGCAPAPACDVWRQHSQAVLAQTAQALLALLGSAEHLAAKCDWQPAASTLRMLKWAAAEVLHFAAEHTARGSWKGPEGQEPRLLQADGARLARAACSALAALVLQPASQDSACMTASAEAAQREVPMPPANLPALQPCHREEQPVQPAAQNPGDTLLQSAAAPPNPAASDPLPGGQPAESEHAGRDARDMRLATAVSTVLLWLAHQKLLKTSSQLTLFSSLCATLTALAATDAAVRRQLASSSSAGWQTFVDGLRQSQPKATMAQLLPYLTGVASVVLASPGQQAAVRAGALEDLTQQAAWSSAGTEALFSSGCGAKAAVQTADVDRQDRQGTGLPAVSTGAAAGPNDGKMRATKAQKKQARRKTERATSSDELFAELLHRDELAAAAGAKAGQTGGTRPKQKGKSKRRGA